MDQFNTKSKIIVNEKLIKSFFASQDSRKELLGLDFEGTLKYFRINLPKKYMSEKCRQDIFTTIYSFKVKIYFFEFCFWFMWRIGRKNVIC